MSEERKLVEVQLQRWRPELLTIVVSVPESWTDKQVKDKLSDIYAQADSASDNWTEQVDYDVKEGDHEVTGEPVLTACPDLVFPEEDDDD